MMRTTLNLPDDVSRIVRAVATAKGVSMGEAAAELIRRALRPEGRIVEDSGIPFFAVPDDAQPITLEQTLALEDEP
jgi:plasmid stability protein